MRSLFPALLLFSKIFLLLCAAGQDKVGPLKVPPFLPWSSLPPFFFTLLHLFAWKHMFVRVTKIFLSVHPLCRVFQTFVPPPPSEEGVNRPSSTCDLAEFLFLFRSLVRFTPEARRSSGQAGTQVRLEETHPPPAAFFFSANLAQFPGCLVFSCPPKS